MRLLALLLGCTGTGLDTSAVEEGCARQGPRPRVQELPSLPAWESSERANATGLGWGDVDGDGLRDLVVANGNDVRRGTVSVHRGQTNGALARAPGWQSEGEHFHGHLAIGDVDGDGFDDVVVARYLGDGGFGDPGGVDLYRGGPQGLSPLPVWRADGFSSFSVALGDVDGDGALDLAVATGEVYEGLPATDRVYENRGGVFLDAPVWESERLTVSLAVRFVDGDGDGDLDLVFARSGTPNVRYDNDGGLGPLPAWEAPGSRFDGNGLDFGDVDGDGLADLLVSDNTIGGAGGEVRLFCGPAWEPCWTSPVTGEPWSAVSLIDVDGDGDLDAVLGSWWGPVRVHDNHRGALSQQAWESATSTVIEAFAWHDLDGAHEEPGCVEGMGMVALPRGARVLEVEPPGAAVGDGYVSAPGRVWVRYALSRQLDLAVSNWDADRGSVLFLRD